MSDLPTILHDWRHLNWPGLLFVVLLLPGTTLIHYLLRKWAEGPLSVKRKPPQRAVPRCAWADGQGRPIYQAPVHQHVADLERSRIIVRDDNSVLVQCCVSGCAETMVMGNNIAAAWLIDTTKETQR